MTGSRTHRLPKAIRAVLESRKIRIPTPELNRKIRQWQEAHPPPIRKNKRPKIIYATQAETIEFFAKHGYTLIEQKEFCYVPILSLKSRYARLAASYLVNPIANFFPRKDAGYWLAVFERRS